MFKEILLFELVYRRNRPASYVYWGIAFLVGFLGVASSILRLGTPVSAVHANAPFMIFRMTLVACFVLSIITSAVVSVTIIRDFDHKMDVMLFSMPIRKWDYLMGRFFGSVILLVLINTGIFFGFAFGFAIGKIVPWDVTWKGEELLPFNLWSYVYPFCVVVLPNLFFTSALFFMSGALWRNTIAIYAQGILLLILYQISFSYLREMDSQYLAGIIDPFALQSFLVETRYWTPTEQNMLFVPLSGVFLQNRLAWTGIGIAALAVTYKFFSFTAKNTSVSKKEIDHAESQPVTDLIQLLPATAPINAKSYLKQLMQLSWFYFKMISTEIPFLVMVGAGVLLFFVAAFRMSSIYGTGVYPATSLLIDQINTSFGLFLVIIAVFYSGELVWKERSSNFHQISDALPTPSFVGLTSKFIGLALVYFVLLIALILCGILAQVFHQYYNFQLAVYFKALLLPLMIALVSLTLLFMFIQVISVNKFSGFVWSVVFIIANALLKQFGIEDDAWQFGSGTLGVYSDMNAFGHLVEPFVWFKFYWLSFAGVLFIGAVLLSVRGNETGFRMRWTEGKRRLTKSLVLLTTATIIVFLFSRFFIHYNTSVLNHLEKMSEHNSKQAMYEKKLGKNKLLPQLKIVESSTSMSLYPSMRAFTIEGFYYLKNKSQELISDVQVQNAIDPHISVEYVRFDRPSSIQEIFPEFNFTGYKLGQPLHPGDSVKMSFKVLFVTRGFEQGKSNTDVLYNGTLISNSYLPRIGYDDNFELANAIDRKKFGLKPRVHLTDPIEGGSKQNAHDLNADRIRFETVVSTENDQAALAPGELIKHWKDSNRSYFKYRTRVPIANSYSVISGRYAKKEDRWRDVKLEIYHHPSHEYNLDKMMKAMKDALSFCSERFGPYPHRILRIVEFPRYKNVANSFATVIPFSEGVDFLLKERNPVKDPDVGYYITSHEVAHQWWGQQLLPAKALGMSVISEGIAQYVALMVVKKEFSRETMGQFLKFELNNYLRGRAQEKEVENPLTKVDDQPYISRNKAALAFYSLQDYLGESVVDSTLGNFYNEWLLREGLYPSSKDLINSLSRVTPDSLHYLTHDLFETVTLFENKTLDAVYREEKEGKYEVTLSVSCEKIRIDKQLAGEQKSLLNEWIDVGVYALDDQGHEKLVYLKKHLITKKVTNIVCTLNSRPVRAGIDPLHMLPDRYSEDNVIAVKEYINLSNLPVDLE